MAQNASDSQKVDYLWKKIVYGATKTDISGNIDATQEPFASPLLIRGDKILTQSASIPNIKPGGNTSVVTVYTGSLPIECTADSGIATPTLTWVTGVTNWISPEFGSTYQVKVYISPSGQAGNVSTKGTQVFATGSGNNDLWVFDYQSGILNFNSNNTPYSGVSPISFTGNSVYISGAVYSGAVGLTTLGTGITVNIGNLTFNGNTISSSQADGNIVINAPGNGVVQIIGSDAVQIPSGGDGTRPVYPLVGYTRFNTERATLEAWDGNAWQGGAEYSITSDVITPDGTSNVFTLSSNSSTTGVMVSINGTLQQPTTSYNIVNNNQIRFTEIPLTTDIIEVRHIAIGAVAVSSLASGNTSITLDQDTNAIKFVTTGTNWFDINSTGAIVTKLPNVTVTAGNITTIDSYDSRSFRTAKYVIQATSSIDSESYEAMVTHNANNSAYTTVYAVINTGNTLGNISATLSSNTVQVQYTAFSSNVYVKLSKNYIQL
jgi:hypothetical protein